MYSSRCAAVVVSALIALMGTLIVGSAPPATAASSASSTWKNVTPTSPAESPSARAGASMAYDPHTGQLVLFGGDGGNGDGLADTWIWDGSGWKNVTPATSPGARGSASLAYDPGTGQLILFGGLLEHVLGDTWTWDGTTWTQLTPATSPSARYGASMNYDPTTGQLVLFGGSNGSPYLGAWVRTGQPGDGDQHR